MSVDYGVLIVGAGHAGAQTAIALRQNGFDGTIAIVGEEPDAPYERPALSKDYVSGARTFEQMLIRPEGFWVERGVDLRLGQRVDAVDPEAHFATLGDGSILTYGVLVWAAGGASRRLSCVGHDLSGIHTLRTRADADRLRAEANDARHVVVIGGGFIGLEGAAFLTTLGKAVVLLEAADRVLARVAAGPLSRFFEAEHRARGVDVRVNAKVDCILGQDGQATNVQMADGSVLAADMVVVGIGIVPAVQPLLAAGAEGTDGVQVDAYGRTTLPDVYAAGDCALHRNAFAEDRWLRLESVQNAGDQATTVARAIVGRPQPYHSTPWFWSDQYDLKLQTIGLSTGFDEVVVRGDPATRSFSVIMLRGGRIVALDCVNATRDYVQGKALVIEGASPDRRALADPATPLKSLRAAA